VAEGIGAGNRFLLVGKRSAGFETTGDERCIVADRGMIAAATIADLEARGIDYILGVRERSTREVREDVIDDDGVTVPLVIPRQKGETQLAGPAP
jgi:hypothetical protein